VGCVSPGQQHTSKSHPARAWPTHHLAVRTAVLAPTGRQTAPSTHGAHSAPDASGQGTRCRSAQCVHIARRTALLSGHASSFTPRNAAEAKGSGSAPLLPRASGRRDNPGPTMYAQGARPYLIVGRDDDRSPLRLTRPTPTTGRFRPTSWPPSTTPAAVEPDAGSVGDRRHIREPGPIADVSHPS